MANGATGDQKLREQATRRVKRKKHFWNNFAAYVIINAFFVGIWAIGGQGYFWPIWVIGGWGIGVAFNAWHAFGEKGEVSEADIRREMDKLKGN